MTTVQLPSRQIDEVLAAELSGLRDRHLERNLRRTGHRRGAIVQTDYGQAVDFSSNDYLGLASELRPHNIAVNCLAPRKVILTEGAIAGGMADRVSDDMVEDPSAIVQAAVWLASQDASGVTGTIQYSLDLLEKLSGTAFPS